MLFLFRVVYRKNKSVLQEMMSTISSGNASNMDVQYYHAMKEKQESPEVAELIKQLMEEKRQRREQEKRAELAETRLADESKRRKAAEELTKNPKKALVLSEMNAMKRKKKEKGQNLYYKNQEETAMKILKNINKK